MARMESALVPLPACLPTSASAVTTTTATPRHSTLVRVTHWITTLCFFALLVSGFEIVISHPNHLTITDNLKGVGKGLGSASADAGCAWRAGI
jgi:hypothetical protein